MQIVAETTVLTSSKLLDFVKVSSEPLAHVVIRIEQLRVCDIKGLAIHLVASLISMEIGGSSNMVDHRRLLSQLENIKLGSVDFDLALDGIKFRKRSCVLRGSRH